MQKALLVGCFCAGVLLASTAYADTYVFDFTTDDGMAPTSGGFTWNGMSFSGFDVDWDGFTYDLTSAANAYDGRNDFPVNPCNPSGPAGLFSMLTLATTCPSIQWSAENDGGLPDFAFAFDGPQGSTAEYTTSIVANDPMVCDVCSAFGDGTWTVTDTTPPSTVPEPGFLGFLVVMAAVGLTVRKHHGRSAKPMKT
jgi:hypothetical protein